MNFPTNAPSPKISVLSSLADYYPRSMLHEANGYTCIVTGASCSFAAAYAHILASRGASIVVHDFDRDKAQILAYEIRRRGGKAIANSDELHLNAQGLVQAALSNFGNKIDSLLLHNAGEPEVNFFTEIGFKDIDNYINKRIGSMFNLVKAVWEVMKKRKYGRIVSVVTPFSLYGCPEGGALYTAAQYALHGFTMSLAREGERFDFRCNTIAAHIPLRGFIDADPDGSASARAFSSTAAFAYFLSHRECNFTGPLFEISGSFASRLIRQKAPGRIFSASKMSVDDVAANFRDIVAFQPENLVKYPKSIRETDWVGLLEKAQGLPNPPEYSKNLKFNNRTVVVTGAGSGLGRAYALLFGKLGATVLVNDFNEQAANKVVKTITDNGGRAFANCNSVEDCESIINAAYRLCNGRVDVLVNNAGILRDKSFSNLSVNDWNAVITIHLNCTMKMCRAVIPGMIKNKYGRIINTTSVVGLYGNFGQANYGAAKAGVIAFSQTLALQLAKYNILINVIAPNAGTSMTATVMPASVVDALKPDYVAPCVAYLAHETNNRTGYILECGSCWIGRIGWYRSSGFDVISGRSFAKNKVAIPEDFDKHYDDFSCFYKGREIEINSIHDSVENIRNVLSKAVVIKKGRSSNLESANKAVVKFAKIADMRLRHQHSQYSERDLIIYALGVGATQNDLQWVYEAFPDFHALPSFGIICGFKAMENVPLGQIVENFNPMMLLHGEQYMELFEKFPKSCQISNKLQIVDLVPKGNSAALLILGITSFDQNTGKKLAYNESAFFIRHPEGFHWCGEKIKNSGKTRSFKGPDLKSIGQRQPDATVSEITKNDQAAIYRMSGDLNPLHIDPGMSKIGGFSKPILHGLCTLGISSKHVYAEFIPAAVDGTKSSAFAPVKCIQGRMTAIVIPGQSVTTSMWQVSPTRVVFTTKVKDKKGEDKIAINNAAVDFSVPVKSKSGKTAFHDSESSQKNSQGASKSSASAGDTVSTIFTALGAAIGQVPGAMRKQMTSRMAEVYVFKIKNENGVEKTWIYETKKEGSSFRELKNKDDMPKSNDVATIVASLATLKNALGGKRDAASEIAKHSVGDQSKIQALVQVLGFFKNLSRL